MNEHPTVVPTDPSLKDDVHEDKGGVWTVGVQVRRESTIRTTTSPPMQEETREPKIDFLAAGLPIL